MTALIALVGRPNVGKSTLFNRLVGRRQALVDDRPGVTRDRNFGQTNLDGRTATVVDTGGFDPTDLDPLIGQIKGQALLALEEADLTVLVTDGREGLTPHDKELAELIRRSGRPYLVAVNKIDGPEKENGLMDFYELGLEPLYPVSAAHGYGLNDFKSRLAGSLPHEDPEEAAAFEGPRIAVIGRPNAGKSSLINYLSGQNRLVVDHRPGTTRDSVDVLISRPKGDYLFVDTAGVRRKGRVDEKLEKLSVMRALKSLERTDLAVLLFDAELGLADQDAHIAGYAVERGCPLIIMANKWDKIVSGQREEVRRSIRQALEIKMPFVEYVPFLTGSAQSGQGLKNLFPVIDRLMGQYTFRASTAEVNRVLEAAVAAHTPPQMGRGRLKLYYATQVETRPPTFLVFVNRPEVVHFSYERFLHNRFKEAFGLKEIPVKVSFRARRPQRGEP